MRWVERPVSSTGTSSVMTPGARWWTSPLVSRNRVIDLLRFGRRDRPDAGAWGSAVTDPFGINEITAGCLDRPRGTVGGSLQLWTSNDRGRRLPPSAGWI